MRPLQLQPHHVAGAVLFSNRNLMIQSFSHRLKNGVIAELGVALGDFSRSLIDDLAPRRFDAYDIFRLHELESLWGKRTSEIFGTATHLEFYCRRFKREIEQDLVHVFEGDGVKNFKNSDTNYDMIYIDANHDFDSVSRDARASINKLNKDGILVFNDYIMYDHIALVPYGVVHVVNDLCVNHGWRVVGFAFQQDMFADIAIEHS